MLLRRGAADALGGAMTVSGNTCSAEGRGSARAVKPAAAATTGSVGPTSGAIALSAHVGAHTLATRAKRRLQSTRHLRLLGRPARGARTP